MWNTSIKSFFSVVVVILLKIVLQKWFFSFLNPLQHTKNPYSKRWCWSFFIIYIRSKWTTTAIISFRFFFVSDLIFINDNQSSQKKWKNILSMFIMDVFFFYLLIQTNRQPAIQPENNQKKPFKFSWLSQSQYGDSCRNRPTDK